MSEQELIERRKELLEVAEAEAALQNDAVMGYFRQVKEQAVSQLLDARLDIDERTEWRLKAVAQVVSGLNQYLEEKRDLRAFIEDEIRSLESETR